LLDRLYPEEWKQMVQHRVERAAKESARGDNEWLKNSWAFVGDDNLELPYK